MNRKRWFVLLVFLIFVLAAHEFGRSQQRPYKAAKEFLIHNPEVNSILGPNVDASLRVGGVVVINRREVPTYSVKLSGAGIQRIAKITMKSVGSEWEVESASIWDGESERNLKIVGQNL